LDEDGFLTFWGKRGLSLPLGKKKPKRSSFAVLGDEESRENRSECFGEGRGIKKKKKKIRQRTRKGVIGEKQKGAKKEVIGNEKKKSTVRALKWQVATREERPYSLRGGEK